MKASSSGPADRRLVGALLLATGCAGASDVCDGGERWALTVQPDERGVVEVEFDLETFAPGSRWRVVLDHDGETFFDEEVTARGEDGDFWVERARPDRPGPDRFAARATALDTGAVCVGAVTWGR